MVLKVSNLKKAYSSGIAVDSISFSVAKNEIVGLLGPNGAGKTTTINMVLGVLRSDGGSIEINETNLQKQRQKAMQSTNFAAVYAPLPGNLSVAQNLKIFGLIYDVKNLKNRIEDLLVQFDLVKFRDTRCGVLSSGEQTRVSLAKAMLNKPRLLLLDEPTSSLDPSTAKDIRHKIRTMINDGESGCLWTSHNMYEVEEVCDRVLFLSKGKILLEGDPKKLPETHGVKTLEELFIKVANEPLELAK